MPPRRLPSCLLAPPAARMRQQNTIHHQQVKDKEVLSAENHAAAARRHGSMNAGRPPEACCQDATAGCPPAGGGVVAALSMPGLPACSSRELLARPVLLAPPHEIHRLLGLHGCERRVRQHAGDPVHLRRSRKRYDQEVRRRSARVRAFQCSRQARRAFSGISHGHSVCSTAHGQISRFAARIFAG